MKIKNTTYNNFDENIKCCVFTRAFYETPHINFFIEHYKKLGFDKIIILKTDNLNINYYQYSFVELHKVENLCDITLEKYDYIVKNSNYDWILVVDVDEILLLNKKYKNIQSYIYNNLKKNKSINIFYFRWGMIEKYDNFLFNNIEFNYIIDNYNIYSNYHIKSMVKVSELESINNPHIIKIKNQNIIYFENKIITNNKILHHISDHSYKNSILIHLHTRNLNNLVIKSLLTKFQNLKINDNFAFKKLIINYRNYQDKKSIIEEFKKVIGIKAVLPFRHSKTEKIDKILLKNYNKYHYKYPITENLKEIEILKKVFNKFNINYDNYKNFIENINYFFE
jgi:hypothetical protein